VKAIMTGGSRPFCEALNEIDVKTIQSKAVSTLQEAMEAAMTSLSGDYRSSYSWALW
jgi:hypothetical protein